MNIAIMADIHGNHIALEACIGEARAEHWQTNRLFPGTNPSPLAPFLRVESFD